MNDHCLQCECDACLNRGGGTVYVGQGVTHQEQSRRTTRTPFERERMKREQNQRAHVRAKLKKAGLLPLELP
jgi:hypothetical protein